MESGRQYLMLKALLWGGLTDSKAEGKSFRVKRNKHNKGEKRIPEKESKPPAV